MRIALAMIMLLAGCSSTPKAPYFTAEVVDIRMSELKEYWQTPQTPLVTYEGSSRRAARKAKSGGFVIGRIVIDSNGRVADFEIVQSHPGDLYVSDYEEVVTAREYEPSESNHERVPVRVAKLVTFNLGAEQSARISEHIKNEGW